MAILNHIPTYRITNSDFQRDNKAIVVEASTIRLPAGSAPLAQIYDDACDVGIKVRNDDTGEETIWYFTHEDQNGDDIAGWNFKPIPESVRKHPLLKGWRLLIIND